MDSRVRRLRGLVLCLWLLVGVSMLPWLAHGQAGAWALAALAFGALPLLLPLPGLVRLERYTYRWAPLALAPALLISMTEFVASPATRGHTVTTALLAFLALAGVVAVLRALPAAVSPPGQRGP